MGARMTRKFLCYSCKKSKETYPLGCRSHGGCEYCLFLYFLRCISIEKLEYNQICCPLCRILIRPRLVKKILRKYEMKKPIELDDKISREDRIRSKEPQKNFKCAIDYEIHDASRGFNLSCGDTFCKQCLNFFLIDRIKGGNLGAGIIKCPVCKIQMKEEDIELNLSIEVYHQYEYLRIKILSFEDEILVICPFCRVGFTVSKNETTIRCPGCIEEFCTKCYTKHRIDECQARLQIEGLVACPKCGEGVMKIGGCNFMTCR